MLSPHMRETLHLEFGPAQQQAFAALARAQRMASPLVPRAAKDFGYTWLLWRHDALTAQGLPL